jgi:hypothetical protein
MHSAAWPKENSITAVDGVDRHVERLPSWNPPPIAPRTFSTEASIRAVTATRRTDSGASISGSGVPDTSATR